MSHTQVKETEKLIISKEETSSKTTFFRYHKEKTQEGQVKIYEVKDDVYTFFYEGKSIDKVIIKDLDDDDFPSFMNYYGYGFSQNDVDKFFKYKFDEDGIDKLEISNSDTKKTGKKLIVNHKDFSELTSLLNKEIFASRVTRGRILGNFMSDHFPTLKYEYKGLASHKDLVLRSLNEKLINKLNASEIEEIGKFYVEAASKYQRSDLVDRMVVGLQKNVQILTLKQLIEKYESYLKDNPPEATWQKLFDDYITLFDNRYVTKLDYKNIDTGLTKYPDLVLVDIYGFVDFYELKKSGASLLKYDKSHKTYYWSNECAKVIAQAQNYLQKAKENALSYAKSIKEETEIENGEGLEVNVISPKAIIVIGSRKQLNNNRKEEHFKNLRESLKDIEFILYDELLDRLKNLVTKLNVE